LVIPTAATSAATAPAAATASSITARTLATISSASCSTQPACGWSCACSRCAAPATAPSRSNRMQRLDEVPWSIAAT